MAPAVPRPKPQGTPAVKPAISPTPAPPPPPPPAASAKGGGRVIRVTPAEDASSGAISIKLEEGAVVGVGDRGTVYKGGEAVGDFTVTSVTGRSASAKVNQPPHKFNGSLTVQIRGH